jgi:hypothetical protein
VAQITEIGAGQISEEINANLLRQSMSFAKEQAHDP